MEQEIWFSHRENIYEVKNGEFSWTDEKKIWNWDRCTISLAHSYKDNRLIGVVRSNSNTNSKYMGDMPVNVRYMLGFEIKKVSEPKLEKAEVWGGPADRLIFQMGPNHWIWDMVEEEADIKKSYINGLYELISGELKSQTIKSTNVFEVDVETNQDIVPVIYQPAVDSLKNFIREIHCSRNPDNNNEIEVTLVFNNEELRKHSFGGVVNSIYKRIRGVLFGRTKDIESFKIIIKPGKDSKSFTFKDIYSDKSRTLEDDNVHDDKEDAPEHDVLYYFQDKNHPVVFINTSNHAMSEDDNNRRLWKYEYICWVKDAPVKSDTENREEVEIRVKNNG